MSQDEAEDGKNRSATDEQGRYCNHLGRSGGPACVIILNRDVLAEVRNRRHDSKHSHKRSHDHPSSRDPPRYAGLFGKLAKNPVWCDRRHLLPSVLRLRYRVRYSAAAAATIIPGGFLVSNPPPVQGEVSPKVTEGASGLRASSVGPFRRGAPPPEVGEGPYACTSNSAGSGTRVAVQ